MRSRPLAFKLLALGGGVAAALVLGELVLRALDAAAEETAGRRWLTERNEPHFRDRPYDPAKRPCVLRILAIGDSFTWGHGVAAADAYPDLLERRLREFSLDRDFEVLNWSRTGWNTLEEWRSVKGRLEEVEPDLVILGFVLNDPEPTNRGERARLRRTLRRQSPAHPLGRFLDTHSLLFNRIFQAADSAVYLGIHATLAETCDELGLHCLDLRGTYWQLDARTLAVDPFIDAHPNELAHEIAAAAILEHLTGEGLLPSGRQPG